MKVIAIISCLLLIGCDSPEGAEQLSKSAIESGVRSKYIADSRPDIGRFEFHAATETTPALIFDTATGCIETLETITMIDNPEDTRLARRFADGVLPSVTYVDGKPEAVEGTTPPKRCLTFAKGK